MKTLTTDQLVTVAGGTTRANAQITQQLTALQSSIKDVAAANNSSQSGNPMMLMMMMMAMRPQSPQVVAAPAPATPIINVTTRGRW